MMRLRFTATRAQAAALALPLAVLLVATGCDSDQPIQVDAQSLELVMRASGVPAFDPPTVSIGLPSRVVRRVFEDADLNLSTNDPVDHDGDGEGDVWNHCVSLSSADTPITPLSVPMSFSLEVSIIRAGSATPEALTSTAARQVTPALNVTQYDTSPAPELFTPATALGLDANNNIVPVIVAVPPSVVRLFRFQDRKRIMSTANRELIMSSFNPLADVINSGRCSTQDPGPSQIDGKPSLTLTINKGDTLVVKARRADTVLGGLNLNSAQPSLEGVLLLDGRQVSVTGTSVSRNEAGAGISFSFSPR